MLRQTLTLFVVLVLVSLALVVGYALTGLSGPASAIAEAETALNAGQPTECLRQLDIAAKSSALRSDPKLERRYWELRYSSHIALENHKKALEDLDQLFSLSGDAEELSHDRIRLLIQLGDWTTALARIETLLSETPGDGALLQLRGEAHQIRYQQSLKDIVEAIDRELAGTLRDNAMRALRDFIYRPVDDPKVRDGQTYILRVFQEQNASNRNLSLSADLSATRKQVQACLEDYRAALEVQGEPTSAYQGLAHALEEGGRTDDLICLAEIYLQRFDHIYTTQAAVDLVRAHAQAGRPRAAAEAADRFLYREGLDWRERVKTDRLHSDVKYLLLDKMRAHLALGERAQVQQTVRTAGEIQRLINLAPEIILVRGLFQESQDNDEDAAKLFESFVRSQGRDGRAVPIAGEDLVSVALSHLTDTAADGERDRVHALWIEYRRDYPEPWAARARYRLAKGLFSAAYEDARQAMLRDPENEPALQLLARTAEAHFEASDRHGKGLLTSCKGAGTDLPPQASDDEPVAYLLCARAAVANRDWDIAFACAQKAAGAWVWAYEPRILQARAALELDQPGEAVLALRTALSFEEDRAGDDDTAMVMRLLRDAVSIQGLPTDDLLTNTMRTIPATADAIEDLLRSTLERGPEGVLGTLTRRALAVQDPPASLLSAAAEAAARIDEPKLAAQALELLTEAKAPTALKLPALAELMRARATNKTDEQLSREAVRLLPMAESHPQTLAQLARELGRADRPGAALTLMRAVLEQSESSERTGANYALAGEFALRAGERRLARDLLTAAVAFEDGARAAISLAYTFLDAGDETSAALATELRTKAQPMPAPLLWMLGRRQNAADQAKARLQVQPSDMASLAIRAVELPEATVDEELRTLAQAHPQELIEAVLWLDQPGFEDLAVVTSGALLDLAPTAAFPRLIRARALLLAGRTEEATSMLLEIAAAPSPPWSLHHVAADAAMILGVKATPRPLNELILAGFGNPEGSITPHQAVAASRILAARAQAAGFPDAVMSAKVEAWRLHPVESGVTLEDVMALFGSGRVTESLEILGAMEPSLPPERRGEWIQQYFLCATYLALHQKETIVRELARRRATRMIQDEGHWYDAVRFLILEEEERLGPILEDRRNDSDIRRRRHLDWAHGVMDFHLDGAPQPEAGLEWALNTIASLDKDESARERIEQLLARQPGSVTLWHLRALLIDRTGATAKAVSELRNVFDYIPDPRLAANRAVIAGAAGIDRPRDRDDLLAVSEGQRNRADVQLGLGLLSLRRGDHAAADAHLAAAPDWGAGARDYFRAMAKLGIGGSKEATAAAELFAKVAADHPGRPLVANAQHFATQLRVR